MTNQVDDSATLRRRLMVVRDAASKPVALFITKSRFYESATQRRLRNITLGSVQDWKIFDKEAIDTTTLVLLAAKYLCADGVDAVEVSMPDGRVASRLKKFGFARAGVLNFLFRASPGSALADKSLHDPALWSIRPADGDNFFS